MNSLFLFWLIVATVTNWMLADDSSEHGLLNQPGRISTTCKCGWSNKPKGRIINGIETYINEYPSMAGIYHTRRQIIFCGGTIITNYHILTAAHCVERYRTYFEHIQVVLGEHDQTVANETYATLYFKIQSIILHTNFNLIGHVDDVAILSLKKEISFTDKIGPACMPTENNLLVGDKVRALGWGVVSENGPNSKVLMKVDLDIAPLKGCHAEFTEINVEKKKQLCTFHPAKDTCQGDSGGPLLWLDKELNRYVLVAVTSYGRLCGDTTPSVNANVAFYMPWISTIIAEKGRNTMMCTKDLFENEINRPPKSNVHVAKSNLI